MTSASPKDAEIESQPAHDADSAHDSGAALGPNGAVEHRAAGRQAPGRFVEVTDAVAGVRGWMTPGQAALLWRSARVLDPGQRIVEIGSFQGRSTIVLAAGAPSGTEVVAIDPHAGNDRGPNEIDGYAAEAASADVTLTLYSGQHESLGDALASAFEAATGIHVAVRSGKDANLANQILEEGARSKADVFITEEPSQLAALDRKGIFSPVDPATLAKVDPRLNPDSGNWVAYAARSRAIFYNPSLISEDELPKTLADIVDPQYKGMFAWAPSGAFVATTQYLLATEGEAKTTEFLKEIKANGVNEQKNGNVRDTVEAGKHAMGLSNHYYWWVLADESGGPDKLTSKIYHFPTEDAGNLILSSGAGVLKASDQTDEGQKFLAWLTFEDGGQKLIASADIDVSGAQYPVAKGMESSIAGSLDDVESPSFDMDELANSDQAQKLLKQLGMSSG